MVALWLLPMAAVVALKLAEVAAAAIMTAAGTLRVALVLVRVTAAPPAGAGWVRVTVQVVEELGPRLAGAQASVETSAGATRLMVELAELPLWAAVMVAL